ncbi:MAG: 3-dehydroquinate synthase [Lautropia sp.]
MPELIVELGERSYPVQVGHGLLDDNPALAALAAGRSVAIVADDRVDPLYGDRVERLVAGAAAQAIRIVVPAGEATKCWAELDRVHDRLLEARFDRRSLLVAVGGGVVGDLAGFAAATYQRGIDFVQVPTTLLAQVDSSVGGKTAINHARGKNMVGAFHQPRLVVADTGTLATLPPRELAAGLAEVIKHGAIADRAYLERVAAALPALLGRDPAALAEAVVDSIRIKAEVVGRDERESGGARALLNFGHTFGHAIETGAGYGQWLHGEAVAAGMVMAAELSVRLGLIDRPALERLRVLIGEAGLPLRGPDWPAERYLEFMSIDKKAERGTPKFIVLEALGRARMQAAEAGLVAAAIAAHVDQAANAGPVSGGAAPNRSARSPRAAGAAR